MDKLIQTVFLFVSALYLSFLVGAAHAKGTVFNVEGMVYCDKCRAQFNNRLSEPISGATVKLECRNPLEGHLIFSVEAKTDASGKYKIEVDGEHEEEMCQVLLVKSPMEDCSEVPKEAFKQPSSSVSLTTNSGITDKTRQANPLGFMVKKAIPECLQLYKELDMLPDDIVP